MVENTDVVPKTRNYLYRSAEIKWNCSLVFALLALISAIVGATVDNKTALAISGATAIGLSVVIAWLREVATSQQIKADKCRRLVLHATALGIGIPKDELADINAWSVGKKLKRAPFEGDYYQSKFPIGVKRLADTTTESAYFTKFLCGKIHTTLFVVSGVAIGVLMLGLYMANLATDPTLDGVFATLKGAAVFVGFLVSADVAILAKKFLDLTRAAEKAYAACAILRDQDAPDLEAVRTVCDDYGIACLQCPPIPLWLFQRHQNALNDAYQRAHLVERG
ncbi:MAG: hypothetical protein ING64_11855 [Rhodocyclaceae bacterium]|jgi:hypothetical protein|nr:hypothetical protein [Rhodocyclaceae bacterium]MCA3022365.1 hypothetical protein [Rhodocyclaceae bacterium]MCA3054523.1 hypothetical protein [Rhodocyclaceae bacterium]MCA3057033.1 hypothetical protein [Rhodocyclaceae bacterium]